MDKYVQKIQILLLGRNSAGKTTLANILSNNKQAPQVTTDTTTTKCQYSPDGKSNYEITIIDTMGVSDNSMPWARIAQISNSKTQAILLLLISSIDNQSYTDAQKITEALLDKSLENPNSRVMVVLNLYEGSNSKVNNEQILKYFYLRNIRVFQFCLLKTQRQEIMKKIYLRHIIHTYKSQSKVLDSFKICLLGTNYSNKQELFSKLTGKNTQQFKNQTKSTIKKKIGQNTFQISIWMYEDIDSSDTVKWTQFWGKIRQPLIKQSKSDGKLLFDKTILVINNQMIANEKQYKTNMDIFKTLKDKKYPQQIILYRPFLNEMIGKAQSFFFDQKKNNQTKKRYQNKKMYQIPIYNIDEQSSQRSLAWSLQDLISQKIFKEKKEKFQKIVKRKQPPAYFPQQKYQMIQDCSDINIQVHQTPGAQREQYKVKKDKDPGNLQSTININISSDNLIQTDQKQTSYSTNKPTQNYLNKPALNFANKPAQNSANKPTQNYLNKPAQNSASKPTQNTLKKPAQNSINKPAQNSVNRPTQNSTSKLKQNEQKIQRRCKCQIF